MKPKRVRPDEISPRNRNEAKKDKKIEECKEEKRNNHDLRC